MLSLFGEWYDLSVYDNFLQGSIVRRIWARSRRAMSPQSWYIANVDTKELSYENFGILGDWFYNKHVELFRSIRLPCLPSGYDAWCAEYTAQPGALFALPPEVLGLVFARLQQLPYVVAFAITCKYLLGVGKNEVLRATRAFHAPWAGCRLICFGTHMLPDDLPERMLTPKEKEDMRTWFAAWKLSSSELDGDEGEGGADAGAQAQGEGAGADDEDGPDDDTGGTERAVSFPDVACADYRLVFGWVWALARVDSAQRLVAAIEQEGKPPPDVVSEGAQGADITTRADVGRAGASERDLALFSALYGSDHWAAAYPPGTRVLCNLSKAEYVREDALRIACEEDTGMRIGWGHVLISQICWSSDPDSGMPASEEENAKLWRGPWAGDRVCITSLDVLPQAERGREWRDVSSDVEAMLGSAWKSLEGGKNRDPSDGVNYAYHPWEVRYSWRESE